MGVVPILHSHSVAEVQDLIATKDEENKRIQKAGEDGIAKLSKLDPAWPGDWASYLARYADAKSAAQAKILALVALSTPALPFPVPREIIPAEDTWLAFTAFLTPNPYGDRDGQGQVALMIIGR